MNGAGPSSLRRVDWRFLLPAPAGEAYENAWVAGADAELTAALAGTGLARRVRGGNTGGSDHDLVVLPPSGVPIAPAVRSLRPGGVLCWQIDRRAAGLATTTPARARACLRALGLGPVEVYWARGGHERPVSYVPLGADEPVGWYARQTLAARRVPVPAVFPLAGALTRASRRAAASVVSTFTLVAIADPGADRASLTPAVTTRGALAAGFAGTILLLGGEGDWSRVTALPFEAGAIDPTAVLKVPRSSRFNRNIEHEWAVLGRVRAAIGAMPDTVPEPIGAFELNGLRGTVERRVEGVPLRLLVRGPRSRARALEELDRGVRWLVELHRAPAAGARAATLKGVVEPVLERYCATFRPVAGERILIDRCRAELLEIGDREVPLVWEHHDFGPWNLLGGRNALGVIDWEVARPGVGLCDLLFFVMHWNWDARGCRSEESRRRALRALARPRGPTDELAAAAATAIADYVRELRLDPRILPFALVHLLAEQSLDRVARLRALSADLPEERATNRYAGYLEALAADAGRLFDEPVFGQVGVPR